MWKLTTDPEDAPQQPQHITIEFSKGLPVKVNVLDEKKEYTDPVDIFLALNALARKHGIGRVDIVENRFIGVKSRGCYESPGATILRAAHVDLEGLTLDRNVRALRDQFITVELSRILYNGHFFTPEREFVTSAIPASQRTVNGTVRLKLYKGNVVIDGRYSDEVRAYHYIPNPLYLGFIQGLYDERQSSMDELGGFEPSDTTGFIQIESIRIKKYVILVNRLESFTNNLVTGGRKPTSARARLVYHLRMCMVVACRRKSRYNAYQRYHCITP